MHIHYLSSVHVKGSKNIAIKMLKDVGMTTLPKSRETSTVHMQQDRG